MMLSPKELSSLLRYVELLNSFNLGVIVIERAVELKVFREPT